MIPIKEKNLDYEIETLETAQAEVDQFTIKEKNLDYEIETWLPRRGVSVMYDDQREESRLRD